jgi:hypothetical protein
MRVLILGVLLFVLFEPAEIREMLWHTFPLFYLCAALLFILVLMIPFWSKRGVLRTDSRFNLQRLHSQWGRHKAHSATGAVKKIGNAGTQG